MSSSLLPWLNFSTCLLFLTKLTKNMDSVFASGTILESSHILDHFCLITSMLLQNQFMGVLWSNSSSMTDIWEFWIPQVLVTYDSRPNSWTKWGCANKFFFKKKYLNCMHFWEFARFANPLLEPFCIHAFWGASPQSDCSRPFICSITFCITLLSEPIN